MKLLYFTKYENLGASSRLRSYQFFPYLEKLGYEVNYQALFKNNYVTNLYQKKSNLLNLVKSYFIRFLFVLSVILKFRRYDLIIIEKELFPYTPYFFEFIFNRLNIKFIVDYDDPIFHNYDLHPQKLVRTLLGNKIDKVMYYSSHVFAGNEYLMDRAKKANANSITFMPTVIDLKDYNLEVSYPKEEFILGWIGSPSTKRYIEKFFPVFEKIHSKYPFFKVHLIGLNENYEKYPFIKTIKWTKETEVLEINKFSLGVMPLYDSPFEKGKCSYKLIQYMGCSKPCIASPIGSNNQVITENWNGKFAKNEDEWFDEIDFFVNNKEALIKFGLNGRKRIEEIYNLQTNVIKINRIFKNLANDSR